MGADRLWAGHPRPFIDLTAAVALARYLRTPYRDMLEDGLGDLAMRLDIANRAAEAEAAAVKRAMER